MSVLHKARSEEHTSELQSRFDLVCRLLLEKKKSGTDVGLMKFGDVIRLIDRNQNKLTDSELLRIMQTHGVTDAVAWVLRHMDETFHTHAVELLALEKHGNEKLLRSQMRSPGYVNAWSESMRGRLQSKSRGSVRPVAPAHRGS